MKLFVVLLEAERRYWQDLFTRLPCLEAASRVAGIHRVQTYRHLTKCDLDFRAVSPPCRPLTKQEVGMRLYDFLDRHERRYWLQLLRDAKTVAEAAMRAGVNRNTVYNRMKRLNIKPWKQPDGLGGNAAWRALAEREFGQRALSLGL